MFALSSATAETAASADVLTSSTDSTIRDLQNLTIEQLAQLQVTSVQKRPTPVAGSAAAIFVITHDDIVRSGASTLAQILRLAPNLQVFQQSASSFTVTARGFSGSAGDQSFSNLMLVLIDGRSVYNPIFTGVYWDMQNVPVDDIDRIEVISGPGGVLWGANAVNGVINVITRSSSDTQGGELRYVNGSQERSLTGQLGGHIGDTLTWRAYGRSLTEFDSRTPSGAKADDEWSSPQGGFRIDWRPRPADTLSLQGDYEQGSEAQQGAPDERISERDLQGQWSHAFTDGGVQVLAYWDRAARETTQGGGAFHVDTYDVEGQGDIQAGTRNTLVVGAGWRLYRYAITTGSSGLVFTPSAADLRVVDVFAQDTLKLARTLDLIAGLKLENDPFSGLSPMPDLRLSWRPRSNLLLWVSASRVIRAPAPFDTQVAEVVAGQTLLHGSPNFQPEKLTAYQIGARIQLGSRVSLSTTLYEDEYDDLRNIQLAPGGFFPLSWGNGIAGRTAGVEAWADWRPLDWWRVTAGLDVLGESLHFKPSAAASAVIGLTQNGDDPRHTARLQSSWTLPHGVSLDAGLRYVDALPSPAVPAYVEMDSRLAWRVTRRIEVAFVGFNLLHARHQELPAPAVAAPRTLEGELRVGF